MNSVKITECSVEERKIIIDGLNKYNLDQVPATLPENWIIYDFVAKNERGEVIAGILAELGYWSGLEVRILWVREDYRNSGIGRKLLSDTEKKAKEKGAVISFLDTFDFQAKDFYLKNGYTIFGELKDFPSGHSRYYLEKRL